jgi:hypothetical protein
MDLPDSRETGTDRVVRDLTSAAKARRLYPASSPILQDVVGTANATLREYLALEPRLTFTVTRDGLVRKGTDISQPAHAAPDLSDRLRDHGVAEVTFLEGLTSDEIVALLEALDTKPGDLAVPDDIGSTLANAGIQHVRTVAVALIVGGTDAGAAVVADDFLRDLVADPDKLATWLSVAATSDPQALASSLADLLATTGWGETAALSASLARAFAEQDADARDGLLGLAMSDSSVSSLLTGMIDNTSVADLSGAIVGGAYGRNMLSMSTALTRLPLGDRFADVMAQVKDILPTLGREPQEITFLEHMVDVRASGAPELPVAETQPAYGKIAALAEVDPERLAGARDDVLRSLDDSDGAVVATLLRLLEQQRDFDLYCRTLDSLAGMVPVLIERGRVAQAERVLAALASRQARENQPWPELSGKLRNAMAEATGQRTMKALVAAISADRGLVPLAREIMRGGGESALAAFVEEALATKPNGPVVAELVVGRRLIDMLVAAASRVQGNRIVSLVLALARSGDPRARQAIDSLAKRPDEMSRREVVAGLAEAGGAGVVSPLSALLADASFEVSAAAARALGGLQVPGASAALAARLATIDVDNKDFELAREIVGALARCFDDPATAALRSLASRRAFVKRGHFVEVNALARQALEQRGGGQP